MSFEWTKGQSSGVSKIRKFLKGNKRVFLLTGKAGTGKTTIIGEALKDYLKDDFYNPELSYGRDKGFIPNGLFTEKQNVLGVCLAHKAKNRLRHSIPNVATFASAYGHVERHLDDGTREFVPSAQKLKKAECKKPFMIFVFDEVSQMSQNMIDIIFRETYSNAKLIFMGDRGQLPPIEENKQDPNADSPLFYFGLGEDQKHHLDERVRQSSENPLLALSDVVYDQIFASNPNLSLVFDAMKNDTISKGKGFESIFKKDFYEIFKNTSSDYLDTKLIAYRRKSVAYYNNAIREYLYKEQAKDYLIKDEIIYMNDSFFYQDFDNDFVCHNSSEYKIKKIDDVVAGGYNCYVAHLDNQDDLEEKDKFLHIIKPSEKPRLKKELDGYAKVNNWKSFWNTKKQFADFQRGYTLTAYKAQGSTYKHVFVDINDIVSVGPISDKRKLQAIYTSMTRPTHTVKFLKTK